MENYKEIDGSWGHESRQKKKFTSKRQKDKEDCAENSRKEQLITERKMRMAVAWDLEEKMFSGIVSKKKKIKKSKLHWI